MGKERKSKKKFNGKLYTLYKPIFHSKKKVENYASNKRRKGDRVIIDYGLHESRKAYFVYIRKGARDI